MEMYRLTVNLYGTLRLVTGTRSISIDLPAEATLHELLGAVFNLYPTLRDKLMDENGALRPEQPLFLNGRNPRLRPEVLDIALQPGDVLSLFSPISSGKVNVEVLRQPALNPGEDGNEG